MVLCQIHKPPFSWQTRSNVLLLSRHFQRLATDCEHLKADYRGFIKTPFFIIRHKMWQEMLDRHYPVLPICFSLLRKVSESQHCNKMPKTHLMLVRYFRNYEKTPLISQRSTIYIYVDIRWKCLVEGSRRAVTITVLVY